MSMHTRDVAGALRRRSDDSRRPRRCAGQGNRTAGDGACSSPAAWGRASAPNWARCGSASRSTPSKRLAVDSFKYLVVTRVLACIVVLPLLVTAANFAGIFGGYVAETVISGMSFGLYWERAFSLIGFSDYIPATLKTCVFGFIIGTISAYLGYNTAGGTAGVGQAATRSVVFSSILVILSNVILVKAIFVLFPKVPEAVSEDDNRIGGGHTLRTGQQVIRRPEGARRGVVRSAARRGVLHSRPERHRQECHAAAPGRADQARRRPHSRGRRG